MKIVRLLAERPEFQETEETRSMLADQLIKSRVRAALGDSNSLPITDQCTRAEQRTRWRLEGCDDPVRVLWITLQVVQGRTNSKSLKHTGGAPRTALRHDGRMARAIVQVGLDSRPVAENWEHRPATDVERLARIASRCPLAVIGALNSALPKGKGFRWESWKRDHQVKAHWNLRTDDLSHQSPETLKFLADLLRV